MTTPIKPTYSDLIDAEDAYRNAKRELESAQRTRPVTPQQQLSGEYGRLSGYIRWVEVSKANLNLIYSRLTGAS